MKILVTGGAGFIGSNFVHYWLKNHSDDQIVNLDKLTYCGNLENLKEVESNKSYLFIKGDICDGELLNGAMKGIDKVVHFAAESHVDRSIMEPATFIETNVIGTQMLLEAALKNKVKHFHHISTDEVFGALKLDDPAKFNENTRYDPRSPYSASKAASDHLVRAYYVTYGLPVTITNTSNNYGPYQYPEKLLPLAITNLIEGKKVPIYGDGKYVRDWLYVEDHCRAIDLVLTKGKVGETYCIGGLEDDVNNLELIKKVLKIMGKDESVLEYVKDRPGHDRRYAVDWSKAKNELGYQPECDLDTYLEKTIQWYQKNESWWKRIKSGEYQKYYKQQYGKN
ncbi:MAG: dTDP-glucose 4,6-dehydratase [Candidatus Kerfeldbacteria bacterium CG_4_10_14_0_8_um_filter_42_10]|uniref:dTDP-glucose 4,6-dehydratase n=1 Tax=Candidatus Kerfeldbacteria bacterium CG_4_10_14_0_8_um_filter_42_10 TaxID=2014248 RepID=A0A2M7RKS5_9BACT|nr:MAG: dTDP-glucose 4,6-dehydratase [Candidatus Kerfeldbacteria bacterium CG_4_10_14_0_8_um_filter_42_10]